MSKWFFVSFDVSQDIHNTPNGGRLYLHDEVTQWLRSTAYHPWVMDLRSKSVPEEGPNGLIWKTTKNFLRVMLKDGKDAVHFKLRFGENSVKSGRCANPTAPKSRCLNPTAKSSQTI